MILRNVLCKKNSSQHDRKQMCCGQLKLEHQMLNFGGSAIKTYSWVFRPIPDFLHIEQKNKVLISDRKYGQAKTKVVLI